MQRRHWLEMLGVAWDAYPLEGCGLLIGESGGDVVERFVPIRNEAESSRHLVQFHCSARDELIAHLDSQSIGTGVHYPAIHLFTHYRRRGWREGQFPHAERLGRALLTLPLFPQMRDEDPLRVCRALSHVLDELAT